MKRERYSVEQIVAVVRQPELGVSAVEIAFQLGISEQTFYRWKKQYGGLEPSEIRELKEKSGRFNSLMGLFADTGDSDVPICALRFAAKFDHVIGGFIRLAGDCDHGGSDCSHCGCHMGRIDCRYDDSPSKSNPWPNVNCEADKKFLTAIASLIDPNAIPSQDSEFQAQMTEAVDQAKELLKREWEVTEENKVAL